MDLRSPLLLPHKARSRLVSKLTEVFESHVPLILAHISPLDPSRLSDSIDVFYRLEPLWDLLPQHNSHMSSLIVSLYKFVTTHRQKGRIIVPSENNIEDFVKSGKDSELNAARYPKIPRQTYTKVGQLLHFLLYQLYRQPSPKAVITEIVKATDGGFSWVALIRSLRAVVGGVGPVGKQFAFVSCKSVDERKAQATFLLKTLELSRALGLLDPVTPAQLWKVFPCRVTAALDAGRFDDLLEAFSLFTLVLPAHNLRRMSVGATTAEQGLCRVFGGDEPGGEAAVNE